MIKLKEEEPQSSIQTSNELTDNETNEKKETLSERCQRIMSARIPDRFQRWKDQYRNDVLLSKRLAQISILYLMQSLAFYLLSWQLSPFRHCLLTFLNSCFFLNCVTLIREKTEQKLNIWNEISNFFKNQSSVINLCLLLYGMKFFSFLSETDYEIVSYGRLALTLFLQNKFLKHSRNQNGTNILIFVAKIFFFGINITLQELKPQLYKCFSLLFFQNLMAAYAHYYIYYQKAKCFVGTNQILFTFKANILSSQNCTFFRFTQPQPFCFIGPILLQSSIYWWLKIQFKPYFLLLKQSKYIPEPSLIVKYRSNQCHKIKTNREYQKSQLIIPIKPQDFEDELCCMCCKNKINVAYGTCQHAWLCSICLEKNIQKRRNYAFSIFYAINQCPQCASLFIKVYQIKDDNPNNILREILNNNWKMFSFVTHFNFTERYI